MNILACIVFCGLVAAPDAAVQRADTLRTSVKIVELEEASHIYLAALEKDPNNVALLVKASASLTDIVAQKTNGATATVHGAQDSPEFREIWRSLGGKASDLATRANAIEPNNPRVAAQYAAAYGYYSASFGMMQAITKGAAKEFKARSQHVIDIAPDLDDGLGYYLIGLFNLLAPWPVGSNADASDYLTLAQSQSPTSVRNNYALGVQRYLANDKQDARKYFQVAIDGTCHPTSSERMFCEFLQAESRRNMASLAK